MRVLHHYWLSSGSRFVRLFLTEQKLDFLPKLEEYWRTETAFLKLNVAGSVPVLVEDDGTVLCGSYVVGNILMIFCQMVICYLGQHRNELR